MAGGDSRDESLNKVLAKSAYVQIPSDTVEQVDFNSEESTKKVIPTHWWDETALSNTERPPPLYTGWKWPEGCCPYYRTSFKSKAGRFVEGHGSVYRDLFDELQKKVSFRHTNEGLPKVLSNMIPSVFEAIQILSKRDQTVQFVFRTFGTDLLEIAEAITAFAEGRHPDYPDFKSDDLILRKDNVFRGRWSPDGGQYQLWSFDGEDIVAKGDDKIMDFLKSKTICGIQDDYEFWAANRWKPSAGKPVWVPSDTNCHHLLLDDNIHNLENDSIASVREQQADGTYRSLSGAEIQATQGLYLIRVPTIEPILDNQWFVNQIDMAQLRFARDRLN